MSTSIEDQRKEVKLSGSKVNQSFGSIYYFFSRYKMTYVVILAVALPVSVLEGLGIAAFFPLFSNVLGNTSEDVGGFAGWITGLAGILPVSSEIGAASLFLGLVFLLKTVGILGRDLLMAYTGAKILYRVKQEIMERYTNAEYQFMVDSQQGSLIYVGLAAPHAVANIHLSVLRILTSGMKVVSILIVLFTLVPTLAAAFIGLGLVYYFCIHLISKKVSYYLGLGRVDVLTRLNIIANEFINGYRQIIAFNTANRWKSTFDKENRTFSEIYAKDLAWQAVPRPILEVAALSLMVGSIMFLNITNPDTFTDGLAAFGVFAVALVQLLPSVNVFGGARLQIMNVLPDVQVAHTALTQAVPSRHKGHLDLPSFETAIVFDDVSFAHKGRDLLLDRVNVTFERGKVTAIVGPSGSGKTTLINLILGLFQPHSGSITVDGTPLKDLTEESWLGRIGFVSQDPFITNSTIEENIRFNRSGHTKEQVIQAATIANAHGFISEFPDGYETSSGDRGIRLSGGQQQRVCIARAVLNSPEVLIFDEATSSLDSIAETQVQKAIDDASANRTVIIIAHRLSTIRQADKIIVLDEGKILEQGTHEELLNSQGHYSRQVAASI
jgi:subfamily B ATP-binding cassette protein MsbA